MADSSAKDRHKDGQGGKISKFSGNSIGRWTWYRGPRSRGCVDVMTGRREYDLEACKGLVGGRIKSPKEAEYRKSGRGPRTAGTANIPDAEWDAAEAELAGEGNQPQDHRSHPLRYAPELAHLSDKSHQKMAIIQRRVQVKRAMAEQRGLDPSVVADEYKATVDAAHAAKMRIDSQVKLDSHSAQIRYTRDHVAFSRLMDSLLEDFPNADDDLLADVVADVLAAHFEGHIEDVTPGDFRFTYHSFNEMVSRSIFAEDADEYVRVGSVDEATQRLKDIGVDLQIYGEIQVNVRSLNFIVFGLEALHRRGIPLPETVILHDDNGSWKSTEAAIAQHDVLSGISTFSKNQIFNSTSEYLSEQQRGYYMGEHEPFSIIIHEIGHHVHSLVVYDGLRDPDIIKKFGRESEFDVEGRNRRVSDIDRKVEKDFKEEKAFIKRSGEVSAYGTTSAFEFVAEVFVGLMMGQRFSNRIQDIYRRLGGYWHPSFDAHD